MIFLAPWALALGALGATGAVLLHLIARQRPAVYLLPTARFIPDRETLVTRAAARPSDLLLLALRVLLLLAAGAAFARPVLTSQRTTYARIVLLDRSAAVADPADAWRRTRAVTASKPEILIAFDSTAARIDLPSAADSSLRVTAVAPPRTGSISAALVAARRAAGALAVRADSVELVLVSPVAAEELDAATDAARALWPGAIRVERVALRADSLAVPVLERAIALDDVLGPSVSSWPVRATPRAVRLRRSPTLGARDSSFAIAGGTVVMWDTAASPFAAQGLSQGGNVIVATLGRYPLRDTGTVVARWADGEAAAVERSLGAGCVRVVGIHVPTNGDLPLRPAFQRIVRGLLSPCQSCAPLNAAGPAPIARLTGAGQLAAASALREGGETTSPVVPWLLGLALVCALVELAIRDRSRKTVTV